MYKTFCNYQASTLLKILININYLFMTILIFIKTFTYENRILIFVNTFLLKLLFIKSDIFSGKIYQIMNAIFT